MSVNILDKLRDIPARFSDEGFLNNKGLSNEVGIYIFAYPPSDEIVVRSFFEDLKSNSDKHYNIIECDLYEIFLEICDDKRLTRNIERTEERRGKDYLVEHLQKAASPEAFVEKMNYSPHRSGDIMLITGVGKVYPFMRSHNILNNIQHIFADIPVVMLYPGDYNGQDLTLFSEFNDGNYYRAFDLL